MERRPDGSGKVTINIQPTMDIIGELTRSLNLPDDWTDADVHDFWLIYRVTSPVIPTDTKVRTPSQDFEDMIASWEDGMTSRAYDDGKAQALIEEARLGAAGADVVLLEVASNLILSGHRLPENLGHYIVERLRDLAPRQRRGRKASINFIRNFRIVRVIEEFARLGISPTRNEATEAESASSMIANALKDTKDELSEATIEDLWSKRSHYSV